MKKTTRILSLIAACFICISAFSFSAYANDYGVMPCYDNISAATINITFDEGVGTAKGTVTKVTGVTSMDGTMEVYKEVNGEWVFVDSATATTTGRRLSVTVNFDAEQGVNYKAVLTIVAYGATTETIVKEHSVVYQ